MPLHYSPEAKATALDLLHEKGGDVPLVSYLTGISERTLYTWRKQLGYSSATQDLEQPQPKHWIRQQPQRQERLQQRREKVLQQQQQHSAMTAFGMSYEELEEALKVEFLPSPYTDLHADLLLHLQHMNYSLTDEPSIAHRTALGFTRILDAALKIEEMVRIEKPQLSLLKYEYPDRTFHDIPYWSNAVHQRATKAYEAVVAEAKRQYEEQQAALKTAPLLSDSEAADMPHEPAPAPAIPAPAIEEDDWDMGEYSVEEILAKPFRPEDFVPKHTGFHKYFLGEDPSPRPRFLGPHQSSDDEDNSTE
jgi:transposase-like protein